MGDAGSDHGSWTSPERMTGARPAEKIDASGPGSDLAMETASAMAAGYIAFKDKGRYIFRLCANYLYAAIHTFHRTFSTPTVLLL